MVSDWVMRWSHLVRPSQTILDVACGHGRHSQFFLSKGCAVTAVDISREALDATRIACPQATAVCADLENAPWPLMRDGKPQTFDAVVVTNYLWRPLMPSLLASLADGGVLIYETFSVGNEVFGKPSRPDFLLQSKELLEVCKDLQVIAYEEGFLPDPDRLIQRVVAMKRAAKMGASSELTRFHL